MTARDYISPEPAAIMALWNLAPDGASFETRSSLLVPARRNGVPVMVKIARHEEEARGNRLMAWWGGRGAAPVLAQHGDAILMPRAAAAPDLASMSAAGQDDEAARILCSAAAALHAAPVASAPADLVPLARWFDDLRQAAADVDGFFARSWAVAAALLAERSETVVLHGDIHHGNVLHFGPPGWRAIDPKGLVGDRAFDFANLFCNPTPEIAGARFKRRLDIVCDAAGLARGRLARWIVAWTGLSATWFRAAGQDASVPMAIGRKALAC